MESSSYTCSTCESFAFSKFTWDSWTREKIKEGSYDSNWNWSQLQWKRYNRYKTVREAARLGCEFCNLLTYSFEKLIRNWTEQDLLPFDWPRQDYWREKWWVHLELLRDPPDNLEKFHISQLKATLGYQNLDHPLKVMTYDLGGPMLKQKGYPSVRFEIAGSTGRIRFVV
jgi:hypothetical protein